MAKNTVLIAMLQLMQGYDIRANLDRALSMILSAADSGAKIAALPEMFSCPYEPAQIKKAAGLSNLALDELKNCAINNNICIVAGSMPFPGLGSKVYNRSVVIDSNGEEIFSHDKIHLFDCNPPGGPKVVESSFIIPGIRLGCFETAWGKCSVIICYDIRFTALTQLIADMGVKILFIPAAFSTSTGPAHWEMLVRMRAMELQGYVIGVQPAFNEGLSYIPYGHSVAAGPFGEIISQASGEESIKLVEIDLDECDKLKSRFPLLEHRRQDLYRTVWLNADRD